MPIDDRIQRRTRLARIGMTALLVGSLAGGCADLPQKTRRHTYAPSFNYISDQQLQSAMWQLAAGVSTLERILAADRVVTPQDRLDVIHTLDQMDAAVASLGPDGWPSNHPRVTRYAGRFREQLARARRNAALEPPSYYLAGNISGNCLACHGEAEQGE